jgi:hypothetical protein
MNNQIKAEAERKRLALANAIRKTTLEFIHYAGVASSWQVYIAMHPAGISFEAFNEIAADDPLADCWWPRSSTNSTLTLLK